LDDNPPIFVLEDRSTIINGSRFEPGIKLSTLPSKCLDFGFDWSGCDINLEFPIINPNPKKSVKPKAGKLAVQDYLEQWLMKSATGDTLIIKDHASGEIADFIEVMESSMTIKFYHCKACSPKKSPGARISELKVIEQVLRSIIYIGTNSLISELYRRVTENQRPNTRMVYGTSTNLKNIGKKFQANRWTFEVCIVNPGIDLNRSIRAENTNTLLIACYEWLGAANASLKIIGS
ncbi:MAG TPA: hypothetical protein PLD52_02165, partial [Bacteroidales bacterium]|nr:hypothetical protein [Bacteroidales bacterium]